MCYNLLTCSYHYIVGYGVANKYIEVQSSHVYNYV